MTIVNSTTSLQQNYCYCRCVSRNSLAFRVPAVGRGVDNEEVELCGYFYFFSELKIAVIAWYIAKILILRIDLPYRLSVHNNNKQLLV